jgi:hypothetical protein
VALIFTLSTVLQVASDERRESTHPRVHTGLARQSAAVTKRHYANKNLVRVDDGATTVTLAGVFATGGKTSAEHAVSDASSRVVVTASGAGDDGHFNLAKKGRAAATVGCVTPVRT